MHPTYFEVHYIFGHDIMFLQPIRAVEIHPWTFTFGNVFGGVHDLLHKQLIKLFFGSNLFVELKACHVCWHLELMTQTCDDGTWAMFKIEALKTSFILKGSQISALQLKEWFKSMTSI